MALGKNCSSEVRCGGLKTSSSDASDKEFLAALPSRERVSSEESGLEALPQDILVKILCSVDYHDLIQLFHVSNKIRDATLIAKQWHPAFNTPSSKTMASKLENDEAPNAPRKERSYRSRISGQNLAGITVDLFGSTEEEHWSMTGLLVETVVLMIFSVNLL